MLSFWLFDYFVIKVYVYGRLVPASFFPELWTVLNLCRNIGGGGTHGALAAGENVRFLEGAECAAVDESKIIDSGVNSKELNRSHQGESTPHSDPFSVQQSLSMGTEADWPSGAPVVIPVGCCTMWAGPLHVACCYILKNVLY